MRDIKGKIFLCPLIGGCRGNTRATSTSNYFQTLRIERALPRAAGIARHTHFSTVSTVSIACSARGGGGENRSPLLLLLLLHYLLALLLLLLVLSLFASLALSLSLPRLSPLSSSSSLPLASATALLSRVLIVDSRATTPRERKTWDGKRGMEWGGGLVVRACHRIDG